MYGQISYLEPDLHLLLVSLGPLALAAQVSAENRGATLGPRHV